MLKLVAVLALVACSKAMIQCPHNACDALDCPVMDDCNGRVNANGGWCGCCDACITQIAEGENCMSTMLLGVPSTTECADGLTCDVHSMTCKKAAVSQSDDSIANSICLRKKEEIRMSKENGLPLIGVMEPQCDSNGEYAPAQCEGSVCFCVDDMGMAIDGYKSSISELANMGCQCARDLAAYMKSGLIGKLFYCDSNGNYQSGQGPDATTTQKPMLSGSQTGTGSLLTGVLSGGNIMPSGECSKELMSAQGSNLLGAFVPECDADGKYAPRQCQGSECYCVRKDGTKIEGYSSPISMKDHVTCQCARDKDSYEALGLIGRIHTCRGNGNYQQYQCLGSVCYCTDDSGTRLGDQSVSIGNINDLKC
ncbi:thyroglobulin-like [Ruditapes philippinarum]|uniref:thyroglobulin-like n=1 Tax=Ruditapes philippinarum TaxID=129788 RepID=UPI00295AF38F|nr:thyroglobulin-like [Ruditapes philippinarum]